MARFADVNDTAVAVCLLPGTEIAFTKTPERRCLAALGEGDLPREARFRQINKDAPLMHHDTLEFSDGTTILLTFIGSGQEATVEDEEDGDG